MWVTPARQATSSRKKTPPIKKTRELCSRFLFPRQNFPQFVVTQHHLLVAMPVTPRFRVSQVHDAVVVYIKVPHVRVGGAETYVDGREFSFYCKPYLLRSVCTALVGREERLMESSLFERLAVRECTVHICLWRCCLLRQ